MNDTQPIKVVPYSLVKWHLGISIVYLLVVVVSGLSYAMQFLNMYPFPGVEFLSPGRVRMVHTQAVAYAWIANAFFGIIYYILPKLTGFKVLSESFGKVLFFAYNFVILLVVVMILGGYGQALEWGETPVVLDPIIAMAVVAIVVNVLTPVWKARNKAFYVSVWYIVAALVWTPLVYVMGNFLPQYWMPGTGGASIVSMYIHDLVGLFVTPVGVGVIYYLLPILLQKPLYSHALSLIGFWGLAFFYPMNSVHHYLYSPIPMWAQYASVVASVGIHVVVYTVVFNYFATIGSDFKQVVSSLPLRFIVVGALCYLLTCIQCAIQVTLSAQEIIHFTDWVPGHAHLVMFGTFSFWIFAWIYYLWPKLFKTELFSRPLAEWHFWLGTIGIFFMWVDLCAAGVMQGYLWKGLAPFIDSVEASLPFWFFRMIAGIAILVSEVLFAVNMFMTWKFRKVVVVQLGEQTA